jgi:hypothetical protein
MNSFNLLLTILFIVIIYAAIFVKIELQYLLGIVISLFVCLWIYWDNKLSKNYYPRKMKLMLDKTRRNKYSKAVSESDSDSDSDSEYERHEKNKHNYIKVKPLKPDYDIKKNVDKAWNKQKIKKPEYSENNYKYNTYDELAGIGDNLLTHKMKHMSNMNRVAMDNFARQNKNTNIHYFNNELDEHANSVWWDDDTLENEF